MEIIEIYGKCNKDGVLKITFNEPLEFSTDNDYLVRLVSAELVSFFPNIIEGKNNKLHYKVGSLEKEIIFQTGAYEIADPNKHIEDELSSKGKLVDGLSPIKITMEQATGKCKIFLKPYYASDFAKVNSIRNILGFDSVISNDPVNNGQRNERDCRS